MNTYKYDYRTKPVYGVGINDAHSYTRGTKCYLVWKSILARCYSKSFHNANPTYVCCEICNEWKVFSVFREWFNRNYIEGCEIDKDLFGDGTHVYSPQTCVFLPKELNILIKRTMVSQKGMPKGVTHQYRSYIACFRGNGKRYLKSFDNPIDAGIWYAEMRRDYIKERLSYYLSIGMIDDRISNAIKTKLDNDIYKAKSITCVYSL